MALPLAVMAGFALDGLARRAAAEGSDRKEGVVKTLVMEDDRGKRGYLVGLAPDDVRRLLAPRRSS